MRIYDIIEKKRDKKELTKEEIEFFVRGYSSGQIPDYQAAALLMAIFLNKMTNEELTYLTFAMANSAEKLDLSGIKKEGKYIVDKHSSGGVGDKVTLIVLPIVASLGANVCKMSGRGLGITGGTADKLESIIGYDINIPFDQAIEQVKNIGVCLISQSEKIAIADKKMYALRDTTATVESIDLIASSIMSKKIASGADKILLDVTVGSGAFMKTIEDARKLSEIMVNIGKLANRETRAIITSMDEPLGKNVGNALEVQEVIKFLLSDEKMLFSDDIRDLREVVFELSAYMLKMAGYGENIEENKKKVEDAILSKSAYNKFIQLVKAQGGKTEKKYIDWLNEEVETPVLKETVKYSKKITADFTGTIVDIDSKKIGEALVCIGGGRLKKDEQIDHSVGFKFIKKVGDIVEKGDTILMCYYNDEEKFKLAVEYISSSIRVEKIDENETKKLKNKKHILDII